MAHVRQERGFGSAGGIGLFLRLAQAGFQFPANRDIDGNSQVTTELTTVITHGGDHQYHRKTRAVFAHEMPFPSFRLPQFWLVHQRAKTLDRLAELGAQREATGS